MADLPSAAARGTALFASRIIPEHTVVSSLSWHCLLPPCRRILDVEQNTMQHELRASQNKIDSLVEKSCTSCGRITVQGALRASTSYLWQIGDLVA